ncbi:MAG: hypothetical protein ACR2NZ_09135 [Rubripirellula sp.]
MLLSDVLHQAANLHRLRWLGNGTLIRTLVAWIVVAAVASGDDGQQESVEAKLERLTKEVDELREYVNRSPNEPFLQTSDASGPIWQAALIEDPLPLSGPELAASPTPSADSVDRIQRMAAEMSDMRFSMQRINARIDQYEDGLTVSLLNKEWSATVTGALIGEMIFSEQRPVIPSAIVLVSPSFGNDTPTVDIHGKSSKLGVIFRGPDCSGMKTGGAILAYFFGEDFLDDVAGVNLIGGYAEIKNDRWRFLFGRAADVVNPRLPGTLDFNKGRNAGNLGFTRGQFRVESYLQLSRSSQVTSYLALANPIATAYNGNNLNFIEDNGWPNVETRIKYGVGSVSEQFGVKSRRYEIATSGLIGQLRRTDLIDPSVVDVWAFGFDLKADFTDDFRVRAEFFHGQALGNMNGGILQIINPVTLQAVRTTGGWCDCRIQWTNRFRSAFGMGIDDPSNNTVRDGLPNRNAFLFGNLIWDLTSYSEVGFEIAQWDTDYQPAESLGAIAPRNNKSMIYRTRVVFRF